jgi:hypothetical protein
VIKFASSRILISTFRLPECRTTFNRHSGRLKGNSSGLAEIAEGIVAERLGPRRIETFAKQIIKASTIDTIKFLHDESFELRDRFPKDIAVMANAHALEENTRDVIDPLISSKQACAISICTSYGAGADQVFLDSPKAEWLWEYAQDKDVLVHIHPPLVAIGAAAMQKYRLNEALGRPFDTALSAARMIFSGVFDKYPKLKVLFVHMGGAIAPVICRLDWNWELNYNGIQNPPIEKVDKNVRRPSEYFKSNIYADCLGPGAIALKAMIETCGIDRVLFGRLRSGPYEPQAAHRSCG